MLTELTVTHDGPPVRGWILMWALSFALFAGCKWLTFADAKAKGINPGLKRALGYLFAWPGMDARQFLRIPPPTDHAHSIPLAWGLSNLLCGAVLLWGMPPNLIASRPLLAGWTGMIGLVLILHFGLFAILAWTWQRLGVPVTPVMRSPLAATSLAEFWGKRWNTAFHELVHHYAFRPVLRRAGAKAAVMVVFLISGLIHDLVISLPARAGFGLPTLYFLIQGLGVLLERTAVARNLGLNHGPGGWLLTLTFAAGPAFVLFHPPFIQNVILPFLRAIGA